MASHSPARTFFKYLGTVPYDRGLRLQEWLVRQRLNQEFSRSTRASGSAILGPLDGEAKGRATGHVPNLLLLLQHPPTYTLGRRDLRREVVAERQRLEELGAAFHQTSRGGQVTFHGPGQLVGYPILFLKDFKLGVRDYVDAIEATCIDTCAQYGVHATRSPDTGVWVGNDKVAAIGIHVQRFVTSHGFALNCATDLKWFSYIVPCGLVGKGVTSLTAQLEASKRRQGSDDTGDGGGQEREKKVGVEDAVPAIIDAFGRSFRTGTPTELGRFYPKLNSAIDSFLSR